MQLYRTARGSERVFFDSDADALPARYRERFRAMVTALHHVNLTVPPELEAATKSFYGGVVGLKQIPKPPTSRQTGAWYQIGENQLHLSVEDEECGPLSSRHVCFQVADLAEAEQRFRQAGVEIILDSRPIAGTSRFYVRDPGGNQLEIVQAK